MDGDFITRKCLVNEVHSFFIGSLYVLCYNKK